MVDILHGPIRSPDAAPSAREADTYPGCRVIETIDEALALYDRFPGGAMHSVAQSPQWISAWFSAHGRAPFCAVIEDAHGPRLMLPLDILRSGSVPIGRYPGGSHANGNGPVLGRTATAVGRQDLDRLLRAVRVARPDLGLIDLHQQADTICGLPNPMRQFPSMPSPNISLSLSLEGGFDAVLARHNGKRRRKKFRTATRKLEAFGGYRYVRAQSRADADAILDAFFAMKARRFAKAGIRDVFASDAVQRFLRQLFGDSAASQDGRFELNAIEVDGRYAAINGLSVTEKVLTAEFGTIDEAFDRASPGELQYYLTIEDACRRGFCVFDFSVGDEQYKRSWCEIETEHFDTLIPLTAAGHVLARWKRSRAATIRRIKSDQRLWPLIKRLRALLGGSQQADKRPDEDD